MSELGTGEATSQKERASGDLSVQMRSFGKRRKQNQEREVRFG